MNGAPGDLPTDDGRLSLFDTVSIIIGIVIGATIYKMPPFILSNVAGPWQAMGVWALGGVLSLIGALCYAELASTYPGSGGDYVFLGRAFGPWLGFAFGWAQLAVLLPSSIGTMAFVFADYAIEAGVPLVRESKSLTVALLAAAAVIVISGINVVGIVLGKVTQNLLTLAKIVGLGAIIGAGYLWPQPEKWIATEPMNENLPGFGLAMILVMYAYGGWNDSAFVAAEIRHRKRNIPLALIFSVAMIMTIYLLVIASYILVLGFEGVRASKAVAADVLAKQLGPRAHLGMCTLVMISALGALNGLVLTGARVYSRLGQDHGVFHLLGRWNPRGAPAVALVVQAAITLALLIAVGTEDGQTMVNDQLGRLRLAAVEWNKFGGGFETLLSASAPVFWLFFLLSGVALFALRERDGHVQRPFSVPFYPLLPLIFCATCLFMWYSATEYAGKLSLLFGWLPLSLAVPLWLISRHYPASDEPD
jgi:amino acid transporter